MKEKTEENIRRKRARKGTRSEFSIQYTYTFGNIWKDHKSRICKMSHHILTRAPMFLCFICPEIICSHGWEGFDTCTCRLISLPEQNMFFVVLRQPTNLINLSNMTRDQPSSSLDDISLLRELICYMKNNRKCL